MRPHTDPPKDPRSLATLLLGPASAAAFDRPSLRRDYERLIAEGRDREDAMLAAVHPSAREDSELAGEFLGYFMRLMFGVRDGAPDPRLRQAYDVEDLVQSVVGDLLPRLEDLEFTGRSAFLRLLTMRLGWKKQDKLRRPIPASVAPDECESDARVRADQCTPLTAVVREEQEALLVLALNRLDREDQEILRESMSGLSREEMAERAGCSCAALRKRLERARAALRRQIDGLAGAGAVVA